MKLLCIFLSLSFSSCSYLPWVIEDLEVAEKVIEAEQKVGKKDVPTRS